MNNFHEWLLGFAFQLIRIFLVVAVGLVIILARLFIRHWRNSRNAPTEEKKQELLRVIHEWKARGYSYSERLERLRQQGYRKDIADALLGEAEKIQRSHHGS